jgi:pimeloyl-ACP methyl ester carboxylesterase
MVQTNGTSLCVRVGSQGPAIALLHGFGDTGDIWAPLAAVLVKDTGSWKRIRRQLMRVTVADRADYPRVLRFRIDRAMTLYRPHRENGSQ